MSFLDSLSCGSFRFTQGGVFGFCRGAEAVEPGDDQRGVCKPRCHRDSASKKEGPAVLSGRRPPLVLGREAGEEICTPEMWLQSEPAENGTPALVLLY